jgi:hypothetical protein
MGKPNRVVAMIKMDAMKRLKKCMEITLCKQAHSVGAEFARQNISLQLVTM